MYISMIISPIIEYKLCKEGKKIYKKLLNLCTDNYQNLSKISLDDNEYELLLKATPLHRRGNFVNRFHMNGKIIERKNNV